MAAPHFADVSIDALSPGSHAAARQLVRRLCAWAAGADEGALAVTPLEGGITNVLWRVDLVLPANPSASPPPAPACLVRVFGPRTEVLIDRAGDAAAFAFLAEQGFGPELFGTFANGRVEGFLRGVRALEPREMAAPHVAPLIAREVACLHGFAFPGAPAGRDAATSRPLPVLWGVLERWCALATARDGAGEGASAGAGADGASGPGAAAALEIVQALELHSRIPRELAWLRKEVLPVPRRRRRRVPELGEAESEVENGEGGREGESAARVSAAAAASAVVFAHNDLLSGNILLAVEGPGSPPQELRVHIIDYEYGAYNFCGFDVANHFLEHCGFGFDLADVPSREEQLRWLAAYCERAALPEPVPRTAVEAAAFFEELLSAVHDFYLASHLWWGLWALVQARHSPLDFDFASYASRRLAAYDLHKALLFPRS